MTLRVLHAATHGHNIGDGALVAGLQATLREDLMQDIEFQPLDVLDYKLQPKRIMLSRREYRALESEFDLILVGGGGMIEGTKGSFLSGINFNFDLRILRESQLPWVFYALGFNQFYGTHFFHRRQLKALISACSDRGFPFTVRNDGSANRLDDLLPGTTRTHGILTIPDPGFWVPPGHDDPHLTAPDRPRIIVQLAGDKSRKRATHNAAMKHVAQCIESLASEFGALIILAPHLLADLSPLARLLELLPQKIVRQSCRMLPVYAGSQSAPDYFQAYRTADLVLGMRGHSTICSLGVRTPVIALGTHPKVGGLMEALGLQDWYVDLRTYESGTRLQQLASGILANPTEAGRRIDRILPALRKQTQVFHHQIQGMI